MSTLLGLLVLFTGLDYRLFAGQPGAVSVSLAEILSYLFLGAFILSVAITPAQRRRAMLRGIRRSSKLFFLYFAWVWLAALVNMVAVNNLEPMHDIKDAMPGFVLYVGIVALIARRQQLWAVHKVVAGTVAVMSVLGVIQYLFGGPYVNALDEKAFWKYGVLSQGPIAHPVVSTLGHPNALAVFLAPLIILTVGFLAYHGKAALTVWGRCLVWGAVLVGLAALFLTQAKAPAAWTVIGSVLAMGTGRLKVPFSAGRAAWLLGVGVASVVSVGVLLAFAGEWVPDSLRIGTIATRLVLDYQVFEFLGTHRFGILFGGVVSQFQSYSGLDLGVHGEYLSQLLRFGLPAAVFYVLFLLRAIAAQAQPGWPYSLPLIFLALILLLESASGSQLQTLVPLLAALGAAHTRVAAREHQSRPSTPPPAREAPV